MKRSLFLRSKGFTLIEVIVCLILLGIIGTGVAMYFVNAVEGFLLTKATNEACQKVNLALERLSREIKNMDSVSSSTSTSLCFSREGTNFCVARSGSKITMARDSGKAYALIDGVIDGVTANGFSVTLLDGDGNSWLVSTNLSGLSRVSISLTLQIYDSTTRTFSIDINPLFNSTVNSAT